MEKTFQIFVIFCLLSLSALVGCTNGESLFSPDENIQVQVSIEDGTAFYVVLYEGDTVIRPSQLGLELTNESFSSGLKLVSKSAIDQYVDRYTMHHGKQRDILYEANEQRITFKNSKQHLLEIIFRVSDDGVGFRYHLPNPSEELIEITDEKTSYSFRENTKSWMQPMSEAKTGFARTNPSYEEYYQVGISPDTPSPIGAGWVYPALFQSGDHWMLISEAALNPAYCGTRLKAHPGTNSMEIDFPDPREVFPGGGLNPSSEGELYSPWRIITLGDLAGVMESTLGTDLANPAIDMDETFIKPGVASWSWVILKDPSMNYADQERFVDYASDMGWSYTLVDAFWDTNLDYDGVISLANHASEKGVELILWYNSAGDWNDAPLSPRDKMLTSESRQQEFKRISEIGISGVKVDFFGGDGQSMIQYYHDILKDAAKYGIMVNFHGATLPRGWQRTYPHLMTMEAIRGFEFVTFTQEGANRAPAHNVMLPFTRNVFDPMDYTPMVLDTIPYLKRSTTNGHELALPTLFTSGIQHLAETPEGMATVPEFVREYLKDIPTQWDEMRFLAGYPGKFVVLARRDGDTWFISGINGQNQPASVNLDLSFLSESGVLITDGEQWKSFTKMEIDFTSTSSVDVDMKSYGGFVIKAK